VLEGVTYGLRDSFEALKATGAAFEQVMAIGGGTGSRYWVRLIATVLNQPLSRPAGGEFGAALGAARLGLCAATGAEADAVMTAPEVGEVIEPVAELVATYDAGYAAFRAAYPAIRGAQ